MAAAITTTSTIAPPVNFVLMETFLRRANQALVYPLLTDPSRLMKHGGSFSVKWRRFEQETISTSALSELTGNVAFPTRTASAPSITDVTAAVVKYGDYYLLNEEVDFGNPAGQADELMEVLGEQAGRTLNRLARDEMEDNATQIRVGGVGSDAAITAPLTLGAVRKVVRTLNGNSAVKFKPGVGAQDKFNTTPIRESFCAINHTDVTADIEAMAGFKGVETYADAGSAMIGEIGYVGRVRFLETEEASSGANTGGAAATNDLISTGGTAADLYESIFAGMRSTGSVGLDENHPDSPSYAADSHPSIEVITHERGSAGVADALNELSSMGWKFWAVHKITNSAWIRRVTSGATNFA